MKKVFMLLALCALTMAVNASTYNYLCAITELKVDTLQSTSKNQYTITFSQKCKNTAEYTSKPETFYTSTVKIVLNSDDRTLEGVYTTEGASRTSNSANINDQTINMVNTEFTSGSTSRVLYKDESYVSKFVINKEADGSYSIGECTLYFSQRLNQTNIYVYNYSYDAEHILEQGISQTPFVFGYTGEYVTAVYNYDMTVNGVNVTRDNSDYEAIRYFLTLSCSGTCRENNDVRNYEVQLAIYPSAANIAGTYATQGNSSLLYAPNCYVKDLKISKQRNLANDSLSSVMIKDKGNKQYSFYGGTLTCTDPDMNYLAVYGKKRIEAVHYYHFSDNGGEGIPFGYDEENKTVELTPSKVSVDETTEGGETTGYSLTVNATSEGINYTVLLDIESATLAGTHSANSSLSTWSKVERGSSSSYISSGSTVTINAKGGNGYTLSGNLLCENGYTYVLKAFDFNYGNSTTTGIENLSPTLPSREGVKILRDGKLYLMYKGTMYDVQGKRI
ncbi:MAG: hypothetical protein J6M55_06190 [Paludibacteraceae bacterium]|nr:hypothetical protein [Paludibacteraceae bacterium]